MEDGFRKGIQSLRGEMMKERALTPFTLSLYDAYRS